MHGGLKGKSRQEAVPKPGDAALVRPRQDGKQAGQRSKIKG